MESVLPKLGDMNMSEERVKNIRKLTKLYEDSNKADAKFMKKLQRMISKDICSVMCVPVMYSVELDMKLIETNKG